MSRTYISDEIKIEWAEFSYVAHGSGPLGDSYEREVESIGPRIKLFANEGKRSWELRGDEAVEWAEKLGIYYEFGEGEK